MMRAMGEASADVLVVRDIRAQRAALEQVAGAAERERLLRALQQKRDELSAALKERRARRE